jgi:hypothetical protein
MLLFLTSLDDPVVAESFTKSVQLISRQHVVVVNMHQRSEVQPLFSNESIYDERDIHRRMAGHLVWHDLRVLGNSLQKRGIGLRFLKSESMAVELIQQYLELNQRQLL